VGAASKFPGRKGRLVWRDFRGEETGKRWRSEFGTKVSEAQKKLTTNTGVDVTANASGSSLQLALENTKVAATTEEYVAKLAELTRGKTDVIGYAFAINGEINSADIYVSNHLFNKLWPKMLKAAAVEAVSESTVAAVNAPAPKPAAIEGFINEAEKGEAKQRTTSGKSKVVTRDSDDSAVYEARDKADAVIHRNYIKKN